MSDPFTTELRPVASRSRLTPIPSEGQRVVIAGIDIPFWDLVAFMVKWTFAAIPAACIIVVVAFCIALFFGGMFGALFR